MKSVVLRIETGGGSSLAADVILREAILTAKKKPLIVSMGTSAASGGYYASVAGREIFAYRSTITGSIGIFYGKVDVSGLLDKLGVHDRDVPHRAARRRRVDLPPLHRRREARARREGEAVLRPLRRARRRGAPHDARSRRRRRRAARCGRGSRRSSKGLVDQHRRPARGARRGAAARRAARPTRPSSSRPRTTTRSCGFLLDLVGFHLSAKADGLLASALPAALLPFAQLLAPFLVFEPNKPLARAELVEEQGALGTGIPRWRSPCSLAEDARIAVDGVAAIERLSLVTTGDRVLLAGDAGALLSAITGVPRAAVAPSDEEDEGLPGEAFVVAGSLRLAGRDVDEGGARRRDGRGAARPAAAPALDGGGVRRLGRAARRRGARRAARDLAAAALDRVGLGPRRKRRPPGSRCRSGARWCSRRRWRRGPRSLVAEAPLSGLEGAAAGVRARGDRGRDGGAAGADLRGAARRRQRRGRARPRREPHRGARRRRGRGRGAAGRALRRARVVSLTVRTNAEPLRGPSCRRAGSICGAARCASRRRSRRGRRRARSSRRRRRRGPRWWRWCPSSGEGRGRRDGGIGRGCEVGGLPWLRRRRVLSGRPLRPRVRYARAVFPTVRPRRLRRTAAIRALVRETPVAPRTSSSRSSSTRPSRSRARSRPCRASRSSR